MEFLVVLDGPAIAIDHRSRQMLDLIERIDYSN